MSDYRNDKSTCTFYSKIGACRHGEKCSRAHIKPISSETLLLANLYQNPKLNKNDAEELSAKQIQESFDHFYKDIFLKFASLGHVEALVVCENENNHLNGNVYVKFRSKDAAYNACMELNQSWFGGRPVHSEFSPVESFHEANCRAHETDTCTRGDHCNFMHIRNPNSHLRGILFRAQEKSRIVKALQELKKDEEKEKESAKVEQEQQQQQQSQEQQPPMSSLDTVPTTTSAAAVAALFSK
ncbi:hypothetical protein CAAN1_11S03268 [[Candida] anglica]|uniref:Splicing factor U2AF 23 kDa subunit n=1 Tax=[Candida] anglica TaxID=148631 RepID=A0ABP0EIB3_9ASCO